MANRLLDVKNRFIEDETGASMVEYGIALLVVTVVGTTAMTLLGGSVSAYLTNTCAAVGIVC